MIAEKILSLLLGIAMFIPIGVGAACAQAAPELVMPAPIVEVRSDARISRGVGGSWVPGHWVWRRTEWFWVKGHYIFGAVPPMPALLEEEHPPRPSLEHAWVPGHWAWEGWRWIWRPGIWFHP